MPKTLNQFLEEASYLKVKSPGEQKFIDKHTKEVTADRNGNGDDVFKASNVKTIERKKERKGYDPGADEAVYEDKTRVGTLAQRTQAYRDDKAKALKGKQHKIDANKNGKIDAHDFHLLRSRVTEGAEIVFEDDETHIVSAAEAELFSEILPHLSEENEIKFIEEATSSIEGFDRMLSFALSNRDE